MYSKKIKLLYTCFAITTLLSGCEKAKQALGQSKEGPDEFAVYRRAPLSLPPDYGMKPPKPGAKRPQAVKPRDRVIQAFGIKKDLSSKDKLSEKDIPTLSPGELNVLQLTGASKADPAIRMKIEKETSIMATASKSFTDKIAFWQNPSKFGLIIDPEKESKRIRKNQALGTPLNTGDIPVIKRKKKAIFQDAFR